MSDLVERLRSISHMGIGKNNENTALAYEAADEIESLRMVRDDHALEIERLRAALERIAELYYPAEIQRIAREALRDD